MIVFTNGCFDLLHAGHIAHLNEARGFGSRLIVGLNSDASIRRIKGPGRPAQDERTRASVLWALRCVDLVQVFDGDTPEQLVRAIKPDVYAVGPDHDPQQWWPIVAVWGGVVMQTSPRIGASTTKTIEGMRCALPPVAADRCVGCGNVLERGPNGEILCDWCDRMWGMGKYKKQQPENDRCES